MRTPVTTGIQAYMTMVAGQTFIEIDMTKQHFGIIKWKNCFRVNLVSGLLVI
ncbi:MAG: hypothetical protein ACLRHD_11870 [Thomasclavelia spiroformis]